MFRQLQIQFHTWLNLIILHETMDNTYNFWMWSIVSDITLSDHATMKFRIVRADIKMLQLIDSVTMHNIPLQNQSFSEIHRYHNKLKGRNQNNQWDDPIHNFLDLRRDLVCIMDSNDSKFQPRTSFHVRDVFMVV